MFLNTRILGIAICVMIIASCQPNKKSNVKIAHIEQTTTMKDSVGLEIENQKEELSQDSIYMILNGAYSLPDSIGDRLPANAKEYFLHINFPYRLPKDLRIDYFCKKGIISK